MILSKLVGSFDLSGLFVVIVNFVDICWYCGFLELFFILMFVKL